MAKVFVFGGRNISLFNELVEFSNIIPPKILIIPNSQINVKDGEKKIYDRIVRKYRYDLPPSILEKIYNSVLKDKNFEKELKDCWEYKIYDYMKKWDRIIYLPTYRRIEEDFNSYIENSPDKDYYRKDKKKRNFSYLQFGILL